MKNKLEIIIIVLILIFGIGAQSTYAKHKDKKDKHESKHNNKKNHNNHNNKKHHSNHSNHSKHYDYDDGSGTLGVIGAVLGTYAVVDSADSGILDDSSERADRFIYSQIPAGSSEIEINNLFLSSLNPVKEYYEVNYTDSSSIKKCFRVEESGIIRSIYKKMPCQ